MSEKRIKHILAYVAEDAAAEKAINEEDHSINFIISSDKIDRDNERVQVSAVAAAVKDFAKNPVALTGHQHRLSTGQPPVMGNWDTDTFKAKAHHSEMRLKFAVGYELGKNYWYLYSNKFMRAVSLGFFVLDGNWDTVQNRKIYDITKIELFEISPVPVGANREALSKRMKEFFGYPEYPNTKTQPTGNDQIIEMIRKGIADAIAPLEEQITEIKDLMVPDSDGYAQRLLGVDADPSPSAGAGITEQLTRINKSFSPGD